MRTVLVPIDFSPVTQSVMAEAVALAKSSRSRLVIVHVLQPPSVVADYGPPMGALVMPVMETTAGVATRQLSRWKRYAEARKLPVLTACLTGASASQLIAAEAARRSADYIVMGSHGHTALYDLLVGSTTGGLLKGSPCPVIVIPARRSAPARSRRAAKA